MQASAPLKLIFATLTDEKGNPIATHVAFYDIFGGIPEVILPEDGQIRPELVISPINKYMMHQHEIITLWVTSEQREKIGMAIKEMIEKHDPMTQIFSGKLVSTEQADLTNTGFCAETLRSALEILPDVPAKCITVQKLYTVLRMMGGI